MAKPSGDIGGSVVAAVHCRRCGYNLYGLSADRSCPECGLEVWESILHTVDPAASRLPRLRNPDVVGDSLLWLMIALLVAALLLVLRPIAQWIDALDETGLRNLSRLVPVQLPIVAGLIGLAAIYWAGRLTPPADPDYEERDTRIWRDLRLLISGLLICSCLVLSIGVMEIAAVDARIVAGTWLLVAIASMVTLLGLRGVFRIIGLRSREYRTAQGGRQGVWAMVAALAGIAIGQVLRLVADLANLESLGTVGNVISAVCALMIVIGLAYMVVNAAWIRRSLRCPPPRLDEILGH